MPKTSEHQHQVALFEWAAMMENQWPELKMMAAVPNGGARHKAVAGKLKAEGVKAGYPDILLDVARKPYHGLRIEMKAEKGRLSEAQKVWLANLRSRGYCAEVCFGWEAARRTIEKYLNLPSWV